MTRTPPLPPGPFDLIYCDPPLHFTTWSAKGQGKSPSRHYATMPLSELCALPVAAIAAEDAVLAIWPYGPRLSDAFTIMAAFGFTYTSIGFTWIKTTANGKLAFGTGYSTRKGSEMVLLGTRGKGLRVVDHGVREVIMAPVREHSRKPDEVADRLERLYGDVRRLELFARCSRPGWTSWGDQVDIPIVPRSARRAAAATRAGTGVANANVHHRADHRNRRRNPRLSTRRTARHARARR